MGGESSAAINALQQALELEQSGQRFYRQAAGRTSDPRGTRMFLSLADDEVMHEQIIQRQLDALVQGEGWVAQAEVGEVEADLESPLFPQGKVELDRAIRPDDSDLDALLFALKIENDSFNLYLEQAIKATDANARRTFEYLVSAERTHFDLLMLNYEALSQSGGWAE